MQRAEFKSRIRELLPGASETALDHTASYAEELEQEAEECAESLYDAFYVELALVKRDYLCSWHSMASAQSVRNR